MLKPVPAGGTVVREREGEGGREKGREGGREEVRARWEDESIKNGQWIEGLN